jgi:RimJ/RimL family protein N-acetyltransferase
MKSSFFSIQLRKSNQMKISFRQAQMEDAPLIAQAEREIAKEPGYFCSQPFELTDANVEKTIATLLNNERGIYLVGEVEGHMVAHAFLEPLSLQSLRHVAELNLVVHQGWQNQGIGTLLLQHVIEWAKLSQGIEKIELNVRASNARAIALYKKMGFQEEGRLKFDHGFRSQL